MKVIRQTRYASNARNRDAEIRAMMMRRPVVAEPVGTPGNLELERIAKSLGIRKHDATCRACGYVVCNCAAKLMKIVADDANTGSAMDALISKVLDMCNAPFVGGSFTVPAGSSVVGHYSTREGKFVGLSANGVMLKQNEPAAEPAFLVGDRIRWRERFAGRAAGNVMALGRGLDRDRVVWRDDNGTEFMSYPGDLEHATAAPQIPAHWKNTKRWGCETIHERDDGACAVWSASMRAGWFYSPADASGHSPDYNRMQDTLAEAIRAADERWPMVEALPPGWHDMRPDFPGRFFAHTSGATAERRSDLTQWNWFVDGKGACTEPVATRDEAMARALGWVPRFLNELADFDNVQERWGKDYGSHSIYRRSGKWIVNDVGEKHPSLPHAIAAVLETEKRVCPPGKTRFVWASGKVEFMTHEGEARNWVLPIKEHRSFNINDPLPWSIKTATFVRCISVATKRACYHEAGTGEAVSLRCNC